MKTSAKSIFVGAFLGCIALLGGCEGIEEGKPAYDLAQTCVTLQPATDDRFLSAESGDRYEFKDLNADAAGVEKFFLKPSGLGTFLVHDRSGKLLTTKLLGIRQEAEPSVASEWKIRKVIVDDDRFDDQFLYSFRSVKKGHRLTIRRNHLRLSAEGEYNPEQAGFRLKPSTGCTPFPEANLDALISDDLYGKVSERGPIKGFVDFHTHIAFTKSLATVAMSGDTFHPYGIKHALNQCDELHGENGELDLLDGQHANPGTVGHSTKGFPDFEYWPNRYTASHTTAYYMWMKRAYLSGLRLLVTNVTGNPSYCQLLSVIHLGKAEGACNSDDSLAVQTQYIYDMQDYIDAQEGGPGKGWFRIAKSSAEARTIMMSNKLAVVLGSEYGTLFDCRHGEGQCSQEYINNKLDQLHDLGIRSVFPIHRFDNAFGGTRPQGGAAGAWMHLTSKFSTSIIDSVIDLVRPAKALFKKIKGNYWELEKCDNDIKGTSGVKSMRAFIEQDFNFLLETVSNIPVIGSLAAKFLDYSVIKKLEPLPEYKKLKNGVGACNQRPLQNPGYNLLNGLMDRGMIIEIDHMSYPTLVDTLDALESRSYPAVVSSHSWTENKKEIRKRIFRLGGMMAPMNKNVEKIAQTLETFAKEREEAGYLATAGIGTDIQGIATQAMSSPKYLPKYPFNSWDGRVTFTKPKTGNRSFDYQKEGMAHYGLLAEWVESLRIMDEVNGTQNLDILMNSAEAYLQMWEEAESQAL